MNALLSDWHTPFQIPPFDEITEADFAPAFEAALKEARANMEVIAGQPDTPRFANTIEAMEQAEALLELQKKASEILGLSDADENGND